MMSCSVSQINNVATTFAFLHHFLEQLLNNTMHFYVSIVVLTEQEAEFEDQKLELEKRIEENQKNTSKLETKLEKIEKDKIENKKDADKFEIQVEKLQKDLQKEKAKGVNNSQRVVALENDNEVLQNEARHLGYIIEDLELKFDTQLEEIELLQNELEE